MSMIRNAPDGEIVSVRTETHGNAQESLSGAGKATHVLGIAWIEDPVLRTCAGQIVLKLARVCFGMANFKDHWLDIQGYAQIAMDRIHDDGDTEDDGD